MRAEDIQNYKDLESYLKLELAQQTLKKKTVSIELPEVWFFKCTKLIQFYLKEDDKEKFKDILIPEDCKKVIVKMNKIFTVITRK